MFRAGKLWLPVTVFALLLAGRAAPADAQALDSAAGDASAAGTPVGLPTAPIELLPALALKPQAPLSLPASRELPIPLNQRVLSYIELFQGRLHEFMENGMRRGSQYLPMIQQVFNAQGLPPDLAYVALV